MHRQYQTMWLILLMTPLIAQERKLNRPCYVSIQISGMGYEAVNELKADPRIQWWVELEDQLMVRTNRLFLPLPGGRILPVAVAEDRLIFAAAHETKLAELNGQVLAIGGRLALVQMAERLDPAELTHAFAGAGEAHAHGHWLPFQANTVLACRNENMPSRKLPAKRDQITDLLDQIDPYRWFASMYKLACFNRFSFGDEIIPARDWLVGQFQALGLETSLQPFPNWNGIDRVTVTNHNVIAVLPGTERPDEYYIVGAHYDSRASSHGQSLGTAPGAEDNASGVAAVLEMARLFVNNPPKATIFFIGYSGEEQYLIGSRYHTQATIDTGEGPNYRGILVMDMIAYSSDDDYNILLETSSAQADLANTFADAAANYTDLNISTSYNYFGSDHEPYLNQSLPALLVIQNEWNTYPGYHRTTDVSEWLGWEQGLEVLKMNVAALVEMMENPQQ